MDCRHAGISAINFPNTNIVVTGSATLDMMGSGQDHALGALSLTGSSTFNLAHANSITFAGIAGTGTSGNNTLAAGTPIVQIAGGGNIDVANGVSLAINSVIGGSTVINKTNAGLLSLSGNNTYSGSTSIVSGTLVLGADEVIPDASPLTIDSGATFNLNGHSETLAASLNISGSILNTSTTTPATLILASSSASSIGSGTILNGGVNGLVNLTQVGTGTLDFAGPGTISLNNLTVATGTLNINTITTVNTADFTTGTSIVNAATPLVITNQVKLSDGNMATLTGGTSFTLGGSNIVIDSATSPRTLTLSGGTLTFAANPAILASSEFWLDAADINTISQTAGSLARWNSKSTSINSGAYVIPGNINTDDFNGGTPVTPAVATYDPTGGPLGQPVVHTGALLAELSSLQRCQQCRSSIERHS